MEGTLGAGGNCLNSKEGAADFCPEGREVFLPPQEARTARIAMDENMFRMPILISGQTLYTYKFTENLS